MIDAIAWVGFEQDVETMFEADVPAFARQASYDKKIMIDISQLALSVAAEEEKKEEDVPQQVMIITQEPEEPTIALCEKTH